MIQAFPGATIGRLAELVSSGRVNLSSVEFHIIESILLVLQQKKPKLQSLS
jgi:hypothetical protein